MRGAWRLLAALLHVLHGVAIVQLQFPFLDLQARRERIGWWSRTLLRRLGVVLRAEGSFASGAKLVVANHVSWLDIVAVHAVCPEARFVSKAEVQRWPLVRRLVAAGGTLYLQRERRRDALRVVHQVAAVLADGATVAVFPEGTTGDGATLLPFHANLLQSAISAGAPAQAVALRYADARNAVSPAVQWLGDTTLAGSLWCIAGARGLVLHLQVLPAEACATADRRALAARLHQRIADALQPAPDGADAPCAATAAAARAAASASPR